MCLLKNGILGSGLLLTLCSSSFAEIKLPAFFSDRMVLQQQTGANMWGWADAGQEVKVSFAGQTESAKADKDGKWKITFKGLKASKKGAQLTISAGEEKKQINDVVVGEVWLASGQSNMEWTVARTTSKDEAANAEDDLLRVYVSANSTATEEQKDFAGSWKATKPANTMSFTAVGYEFAKSLRAKLDVPVGIIECSWGGKPVESFISDEAIKALPEGKVVVDRKAQAMKNYDPEKIKKRFEASLAKWKIADAEWKKTKKGKRPRQPRMPSNPGLNPGLHSTIYNAMIAPIAGYSSRGAIWYQGESNANPSTDTVYGELLECMIQDWRKRWGSNLSFYYVQLANFNKGNFPGWVHVQDEMRRLLDDPDMQAGNIGMATINDIGHPTDIHPKNKKDVGARLARWALVKDYGMKDIVISGPLYKSHVAKDGKIEITFDHADGLKTRDGKALGSFEVKGNDDKWVPANATISGSKIIVHSDAVKTPKAARYAWSNFAKGANLVNAEGLPTSCFVTK